ncbi:MAG: GNAT family N-acetyltransferase [Lysobacteraceae bacterium]
MSVVVRRADANDLDQLAQLFDDYRQFYKQASNVAAAREFLAERLAANESTVLIAEHDSAVIGFTQLYPLFSSVRMGRTWLLNDLFVAPNARRLGAARALLDAACMFARDHGALGLELETGIDNDNAQALYRRAGWQLGENLHFHYDFVDHPTQQHAGSDHP